jgi:ABC-type amino acid transport substrate-binding protein
MRTVQKLLQTVLLAMFTFMAANQAFAGEKTIEKIIDSGTLKIGVSGNQPPYVMKDANGELMGMDIDLATALAVAMGVKPVFVEMPFGELLPALDKKKVDVVISGVNITLNRAANALFVGPYMMSGKSILTNSKTLASQNESSEFNKKDLKVVALKGSTSEQFIKKVMTHVEFIGVDNYDQAVAMVIDDSADLMVADMAVCVLSVLKHPEAELLSLNRPLTMEPVGIAINRKNPALHSLVKNYFDSYQALGMIDKLREKWFKDGSWVSRLPKRDVSL